MADEYEPLYICQPEELSMMRQAAEMYRQREQFSEMEGVLLGLAEMEMHDPWVFRALGYARQRQSKFEEAAENYERALEICQGDDNVSRINLVPIYFHMGRVEEAIVNLRRIIESGDKSPQICQAIEVLETTLNLRTGETQDS